MAYCEVNKKSNRFHCYGNYEINRKCCVIACLELCLFADYEPLVFLKRPFSLVGHVAFNETRVPKRCPDLPRITFNISYHLPKYVQDVYNIMDTGDPNCPKEILRLTPPPFSGNCSAETFAPLTTVSGLDASFEFEQLPSWIIELLHRLDHLASAVVPRRVQTLNITDHLDVNVKTTRWSSDTDITINGGTIWIPTRYNYNEKLHHPRKSSIDYGFTSMCSLVNSKLTTFHDRIVQLTPELKQEYRLNDTFLLAADCSDTPKIAVFMLDNGKGIQIYTGGNYIVYETIGQQESDPILNINDEQLINLKNVVYQYPPDEEIYDFRVYLNDEDILVVENELNGAVVQYNRKSIASILLPTVHKGRMCGLCSSRAH